MFIRENKSRFPSSRTITAAALFMLAGAAAGYGQTSGTQELPKPDGASTPPVQQFPDEQPAPSFAPQPGAQAPDSPMRNPLGAAPPDLGQKVKVDENLVVDLHVNDEDLGNVLQMLSLQSQRNILASRNVSATVTANLYAVTFYEALDAILHINGYGYVERGNTIYVYTLEELQKIEEQTRPRITKKIVLNYLNSVDAAEFAKGLLSETGTIKSPGKTEPFNVGTVPVGQDDYANEAMIVVHDYEENVEEIEGLLKTLDTRPAQVLVEATILQTAVTEANAFGVDFSIIGDMDFTDFTSVGGPLSVVNNLISGGSNGSGGGNNGNGSGNGNGGAGGVPIPADGKGSGIVVNPGNTAGPATFKLGIVDGDVAVFVKLLDQVSDTTILSRPNVLTLNRQPARVLVGRKVGYLNTTSTDTSTTQTVEFLDTGTQLYFRPFVSSDGMIRMELKPQVSEAVIREATDATGAAVTIPDEITNELTANVMVRDGQTIVLGGLFRESTEASRRQVPFIGDLPIIGAAFRGHDDDTQRNEIIFMITPTIVSDDVLIDAGRRGMAYADRLVAGSREGLLPWSREKHTSRLLVEAERLATEGKTQEALNKVQRTLALSHVQPEAIALRERLMKDKKVWPDRSLLKEITHGELEKRLERVPAPKARGKNDRTFTAVPDNALSQYDSGANAADPARTENVPPADAFNENPGWYESQAPAWDANNPESMPTEESEQGDFVQADEFAQPDETYPPGEVGQVDEFGQPIDGAQPDEFADPEAQFDPENPDAMGDQPAGDWNEFDPEHPEFAEGQAEFTDGEVSGEMSPDDFNGEWAAQEPEALPAPEPVPSVITLHLENIDLATAIELLGQQSGREIQASDQASGHMSADLSGVTFNEALDTLLFPSNLSAIECDRFVFVYTNAESAPDEGEVREWTWIDAGAMDPDALSRFLEPMVSGGGQIVTADGAYGVAPREMFTAAQSATSPIFIYDFTGNCAEVKQFVGALTPRATQAAATPGGDPNHPTISSLLKPTGEPAVTGVDQPDEK